MVQDVSRWGAMLADSAQTAPLLAATYGPDEANWPERLALWQAAATRWQEAFGSGEVLLTRAPARISFNPHSDHQGAHVLYGCHQREMVVAAGWREDSLVQVVYGDPQYASTQSFDLAAEPDLDRAAWEAGWLRYIDAPAVRQSVLELEDTTTNGAARTSSLRYVKAALLRLAHAYPGRLRGLNLALVGDIPTGAGMSSSSAIVVAVALAALALAEIEVSRRPLVAMLGEAEWHVGTRGGAGDHAAMLLGRLGQLTNIAFDPPVTVRDVRRATWPDGYRLWLANSGVRAEKSGRAKRLFNRGVFAYKFAARELAEHLRPEERALISGQRLADFTTERFPLPRLYELLLSVDSDFPAEQLRAKYGAEFDQAAASFFDLSQPDGLPDSLPLRGAAIYGLARADRGLVQDQLLASGTPAAMAEFGRLLSVAHDGDRVTTWLENGAFTAYYGNHTAASDESLAALREQAEVNPGDSAVALRSQPGVYTASIPELDHLVDVARRHDRVLGAGLMGAGGGGVVQVVGDDMVDAEALIADLTRVVPTTTVEEWRSAAGAGLIG